MVSTDSAKRYFVREDDEVSGPYSLEQLRGLAKKGRLSRHSILEPDDGSAWIRASQFPILFSVDSKQPIQSQSVHSHQQNQPTAPSRPSSTRPSQTVDANRPELRSSKTVANSGLTRFHWPIATSILGVCLLIALLALMLFTIDQPSAERAKLNTPSNGQDSELKSEDVNSPDTTPSVAGKIPQNMPVFTTEEVVAKVEASVATIRAGEGSGSGFLVERGLLATNYHVIADARPGDIQCGFSGDTSNAKRLYDCEIIAEDPVHDLALLLVDCSLPPLPVVADYKFRRGQDVIIIGSPALFQGLELLPNAVTKGVMSAELEIRGVPVFQLSLAVNPGNSGGPALGLNGQVVGVVVSKSLTEEGISFCVPPRFLNQLVAGTKDRNPDRVQQCNAEHSARQIVRKWRLTANQLRFIHESVLDELESRFPNSPQSRSGNALAAVAKEVMIQNSPQLLDDSRSDAAAILTSPRLSANLKTELKILQTRLASLQDCINQGGGSADGLMRRIETLHDRFTEQLTSVERILPLGS